MLNQHLDIMRNYFICGTFLATVLFLTACGNGDPSHEGWSKARTEMEGQAQKYLKSARHALKEKDFTKAREEIEVMRRKCDLAFTARNEGILLMDSVDIAEAEDQMTRIGELLNSDTEQVDSLSKVLEECRDKVKFYQRKLKYDIQEMNKPKDGSQ